MPPDSSPHRPSEPASPARSGDVPASRSDTHAPSDKPPKADGEQPSAGPSPMLLASAGLELAAATAGLALGGWWLDGKLGTGPWFMIVGLAFGVIGGTYKIWRVGKRFFED